MRRTYRKAEHIASLLRERAWLVWMVGMASFAGVRAQSGGLSCVGNLNVSVDTACEVWLTPQMLLSTPVVDPAEYAVAVETSDGTPVPQPISAPWLGQPLTVTVTQLATGSSCWTTVVVFDALKPVLPHCPVLEVACDVLPDTLAFPLAVDNCDGAPTVVLESVQTLQPDLCAGPAEVVRVFSASDFSGNVSDTCQQRLRFVYPPLPAFPADVTWSCAQYQQDTAIVQPGPLPERSGQVEVLTGGFCPYSVSWADETIALCGSTFRIIRAWTVMDWCSGQVITTGLNGEDNMQLIAIVDTDAPQISPPNFELVAEMQQPDGCFSQGFVPPASVLDCQQEVSVQIFTPVGELIYANGVDGSAGGHVPPPGLPLGVHPITWLAIDACGNVAAQTAQIAVRDLMPPVAVCDAVTEVALGQSGIVQVPASVFDDGSHDNCCIDRFEARRLVDHCNDSLALVFSPNVHFCCEDVSNGMQTVVVRVYDCDGNFNDCMVLVEVTDKTLPVVHSCPPDTTITCDFYYDSLAVPLQTGNFLPLLPFGMPQAEDNCLTGLSGAFFSVDLDDCSTGAITRTWHITDASGNGPVVCEQTIHIAHVSDFVVEFPPDYTGQCGDSLPDTGEPQIFGASCELVAVSYEDQVFNVVPGACFKIERTWTVINWCVVGDVVDEETLEQPESVLGVDLDGDGDMDDRTFQDSRTLAGVSDLDPDADPWDGFITARQIIKLTDTVAPQIVCPPEMEVCIYGSDCIDSIMIPLPEVVDCSPVLSFDVSSEWGNGQGPWYEVGPGVYPVVFVVADQCGNSSVCETTIRTADCKPPSPYCLNGLVVTIDNNQHAEAWAWFFNAGSTDNCSDELVYSFSADTTDQYAEFECVHLGAEIIEMWVTDQAGNQDYCETILLIQDPNDFCPDALPSVAGKVYTEQGAAVGQVVVTLSGDTLRHDTTGVDGTYLLEELVPGGTYTLTPARSGDWLNGVTTLDLVLITRHILGDDTLDTPYQLIAADANNSHSVTTFDVVLLRRLILAKIDSLPANTSWRFVPADFAFDAADPWTFPEEITLSDLSENVDSLDFIGIKVGDINHTANPEFGDPLPLADRNALPEWPIELVCHMQGESEAVWSLQAGENPQSIVALQFALEFDPDKWELLELIDGRLNAEHVGLRFAPQGRILCSWTDAYPLWPGEQLLSFRLRKKRPDTHASPFLLARTALEALAWDTELQPHRLVLHSEAAQQGSLVCTPPLPNPFADETRVGCYLPQARYVRMRLLDAHGNVVWRRAEQLSAGPHQWTFDDSLLPGPGMYVWVLSTEAGETVVQKLVFTR